MLENDYGSGILVNNLLYLLFTTIFKVKLLYVNTNQIIVVDMKVHTPNATFFEETNCY